MNNIVNTFLLVYAALFPIVNPLGSAPIFLSLTSHCTPKERHSLAGRIALNGFILLLCSLFIGSHVLEFFGITLPVLRIAGGLVVTSFGWTLLQAGKPANDAADSTQAQRSDAFYPLTMPLTIGPGSISVAVALGSQRPKSAMDLAQLGELGASATAGLIAIMATVYFCYRSADRIVQVLGEKGSAVMMRLSAFILLCIGIQILWNGISSLPGVFSH